MKGLKVLAWLLICFFFLSHISHSQQSESLQKVTIENEIYINAKPEQGWTTMSNLNNLAILLPEVLESSKASGTKKGDTVLLTLKANGETVIEKITSSNDEKYFIAYTMIKTPMPLANYKAQMQVVG